MHAEAASECAAASGIAGPAPRPGSEPAPTPAWSWSILALLFAIHTFVQADLWLMAAVLPEVKQELALDETDAAWLPTILLGTAAIAALAAGYLADWMNRPRLLAVGMGIWGMAVVGTGLARGFDGLQLARATAGAGGAAATVVAMTLLVDVFPRRRRGRALAVFFLGMPAGALLSLGIRAAVPVQAGWPTAFLAAGAPGLVLAILSLVLPHPIRGASEPVDSRRLRLHEYIGPSQEDYVDLMVNSSFNYSLLGLAFSAFAVAGLAYWLPPFLASRGMAPQAAGRLAIVILLAAAVVGTVVGGWLADTFAPRRPGRLFLLPGIAMLAAIACVLTFVYARSSTAINLGIFLTEYAMFVAVVPCFTILAGVTMPSMRGVAFGAALAARHLLGDLWSPTILGWVIDTFAQPDTMATPFGRALAALGAVPHAPRGQEPQNLTAGMLLLPVVLVIGSIFLLAGTRHLPREMALMIAKLRAAPSRRGA
ncbi:MAG: MFS transporter [Isosphaeraceae bacterium]